jgi:serine/threonine protein kinase
MKMSDCNSHDLQHQDTDKELPIHPNSSSASGMNRNDIDNALNSEKELGMPLLAIVTAVCNREEVREAGWRIVSGRDRAKVWIYVQNDRTVTPQQGWKLHISASIWSAEEVLRWVLPVLFTENADFKVASSFEVLGDLNEGVRNLSQVGKFITVYPINDDQAIRLATSLDKVTRGLDGPTIPSDRPLASGSLVHYRYGSFAGRQIQTPLGEILSAIVTPDGDLVPDRRLPFYHVPEWTADPFIAAGIATEPPMPQSVVGQYYLIIAKLHQSSQSAVYIAVDVKNAQSCILKQVRLGATGGPKGYGAEDRLRHEARILAHLSPDTRFPTVLELVEQEGELYLAMEDLQGETLETLMHGLLAKGCFLPSEQVVAWGRELCYMLDKIHAYGLVYGDLKPTNIIVTPSGQLSLIDFESTCELDSKARPYRLGTRGYISPQRAARKPAAVTDDIYSLGALLYFLATGAEPSRAPNAFALLDRPPALLNPAVGPELIDVITHCLEPDATKRFLSVASVDAALAQIGPKASVVLPLFGCEPATQAEVDMRYRCRKLAHRLGTSLSKTAHQAPDGSGLAWVSKHAVASGIISRDINTGSAGAVLALAELVAELDDALQRAILIDGARWLITAPRPEGRPVPGLYVGESGIAAALLRAGQVLRDEELINVAAERSRWVATLPYASPDLFNGAAGRLRFHLLLWDETGDANHLLAALEAGKFLLTVAEDTDERGLQWTIPPGYDGLSDRAYIGYAHGTAGIADALLDLFEVTSEERFLVAAQRAGNRLAQLAVPVLEDGSGLDWPSVEGENVGGGLWCHGATGVGRFFLHAAQLSAIKEAIDLAARAARTAARGVRWIGPVQCHGLAGNIEFLLDMFQATGDQTYLSEARSLGRLLEAFKMEQDGLIVFSSESPTVFTPDYLVGYAGIAVCLLRLSDPERLPHQFSRRGFRHYPKA